MKSLLDQLKSRRIKLRLKQYDMRLRVGISRQQYQRPKSRGNARLDTQELVARGLHSEILLIPQEKLPAVKAVLAGETADTSTAEACRAERDSAYRMALGEARRGMMNERGEWR